MEQLKTINEQEIIPVVTELCNEGCRLVQIMCSMVKEGYELTYNFDKVGELINLRLIIPQGGKVESITSRYLYAFIWENEIHDLFGLDFIGMVPDFDYHGKFFHLASAAPWNPQAQVAVPAGLGIDVSVTPQGGGNNG